MRVTSEVLYLPIEAVVHVLDTAHLTRLDYLHVRQSWLDWLKSTGQPKLPISLSPGEYANMDFIDYSLSPEDMQAALEWAAKDAAAPMVVANDLVGAGYRITFTNDDKNGCVVVSVIGRAKTCVNYNKIMTTKHADVTRAFHMAMYKQCMILDFQSWGETDTEAAFG